MKLTVHCLKKSYKIKKNLALEDMMLYICTVEKKLNNPKTGAPVLKRT